MSSERVATLFLSLESSSCPSDTPARRMEPFEPIMQGRLRNTSAPIPPQPYSK